MAKKSKGGKNKAKTKAKSNVKSSTAKLPKLSNFHRAVHESVPTPSSLPQWAIVLIILLAAAVVVLALQRSSISGAFHVGKNDTVKSTNIGFYLATMGFTFDGRYQSVSVARISLSDSYGAAFKFDDGAGGYRYTRSVYFVVKNWTRDSFLPGEVFYYHSGAWRRSRSGQLFLNRGRYTFANSYVVMSPAPSVPAAQQPNLRDIYFQATLPSSPVSYPESFIMNLSEYRGAMAFNATLGRDSYQYSYVGQWNLQWDTRAFRVGILPTFTGTGYRVGVGNTVPVVVGYASPTGSTYYSYDPARKSPVIRYLYDTRQAG